MKATSSAGLGPKLFKLGFGPPATLNNCLSQAILFGSCSAAQHVSLMNAKGEIQVFDCSATRKVGRPLFSFWVEVGSHGSLIAHKWSSDGQILCVLTTEKLKVFSLSEGDYSPVPVWGIEMFMEPQDVEIAQRPHHLRSDMAGAAGAFGNDGDSHCYPQYYDIFVGGSNGLEVYQLKLTQNYSCPVGSSSAPPFGPSTTLLQTYPVVAIALAFTDAWHDPEERCSRTEDVSIDTEAMGSISHVAAASLDGHIGVWKYSDMIQGKVDAEWTVLLPGAFGRVTSLAFAAAADGGGGGGGGGPLHLLVAGWGGAVRVYVRGGGGAAAAAEPRRAGAGAEEEAPAGLPGRGRWALWGEEGATALGQPAWDRQCVTGVEEELGPPTLLCPSRNGRVFSVVRSGENVVQIYDLFEGTTLVKFSFDANNNGEESQGILRGNASKEDLPSTLSVPPGGVCGICCTSDEGGKKNGMDSIDYLWLWKMNGQVWCHELNTTHIHQRCTHEGNKSLLQLKLSDNFKCGSTSEEQFSPSNQSTLARPQKTSECNERDETWQRCVYNGVGERITLLLSPKASNRKTHGGTVVFRKILRYNNEAMYGTAGDQTIDLDVAFVPKDVLLNIRQQKDKGCILHNRFLNHQSFSHCAVIPQVDKQGGTICLNTGSLTFLYFIKYGVWKSTSHTSPAAHVCLSTDGSILIALHLDGKLTLCNLKPEEPEEGPESPKKIDIFPQHPGVCNMVLARGLPDREHDQKDVITLAVMFDHGSSTFHTTLSECGSPDIIEKPVKCGNQFLKGAFNPLSSRVLILNIYASPSEPFKAERKPTFDIYFPSIIGPPTTSGRLSLRAVLLKGTILIFQEILEDTVSVAVNNENDSSVDLLTTNNVEETPVPSSPFYVYRWWACLPEHDVWKCLSPPSQVHQGQPGWGIEQELSQQSVVAMFEQEIEQLRRFLVPPQTPH